jgi:prepilin-type N-terminal cleavage/methylation domain-containing protein
MTERRSTVVRPEEPARVANRGGFSLIEVIIAMIVLVIGVLGFAGSTAYQVRQVTLADLMTERSVAFQSTIDRLQSLPYTSVVPGVDTIGVFAVSWTVTPDGPQSSIVRLYTRGPGISGGVPVLAPNVVDSFDFRILRR